MKSVTGQGIYTSQWIQVKFLQRILSILTNKKKLHTKMNFLSNKYLDWGGEDDDMFHRVVHHAHLKIHRPNPNISHYTMMDHKSSKKSHYKRNLWLLRRGLN